MPDDEVDQVDELGELAEVEPSREQLLVEWMRDVFAPVVSRDFNPQGALVWCSRWWEHPELVARLEALREAWSGLVDDDDAPQDGASTWWLRHVDEHLAVLMDKTTGPFSRCTRGHKPSQPLPWDQFPDVDDLAAVEALAAQIVMPLAAGAEDLGDAEDAAAAAAGLDENDATAGS